MKQIFKYIIFTINSLLIVGVTACNNKPKHELRYLETEEINNNVDKVFSAAKKFADGTNTISDVEQEFKQLNPDELKSLEEKRDGSLFFSLLMTIGIATEESNLLLKTFFAANPVVDSSPKNHAVGTALVKALLSNKRKTAKIPATEYQEISLVLGRYPSMINHFSTADGSFDNQELSDFIEHTDQSTAAIIMPALEQPKLKSWLDWLVLPANRQKTKVIFKSLYTKVPDNEKARLRNQLVASSQDLGSLIDEADDFGIKDGLAQDEYTISSENPGNRYQGNLLSVLTHRAIRAASDSALNELRSYAQKIKNALSNNSLYEALLNNQIREKIKTALEPSKRQWFSNYFLAADTPKDLIDAAENPENISNNQLKELYQKLIDTDAKAVELSQSYASNDKGFIHLLLERPADDKIASLVVQFLTSIGPDQELGQLNNTGRNNKIEKPITLLAKRVQNTDQPTQKAKIFDRLLKNAPTTALDSLSDEKIKDYVTIAITSFLAGKNGADDFKNMYLKITPNKHQLMRDYALEQVIGKGSLSAQRWLLSMANTNDYWGLYPGLAGDTYNLDNNNNLLLAVLSAQAKDENAYAMMRIYAQTIKSALNNNDFKHQITIAKPILQVQLAKSNSEDFADYYLADETPKNVYQAAGKPETKVSNTMLKQLYDLIIGNVKSEAELLANEPVGGNQERFIHRLLKRSIDKAGDSLALLTSFFSTLGLNKEKAQLDDKSGGSKAFKLIFDQTRKNDDVTQKTLLLERLARNVVLSNLDGISPADLAAQVPLLLKNRPAFKKIYSLYASTRPEAQAMRSKLVQEFYAQGSNKTKKFIGEIIASTDHWGLKDGLNSDIYELGGVSGSLLYVLTQRAINDVNTNTNSYNTLSEYAAIIKSQLAVAYDNHVNSAIWNGHTIIDILKSALAGPNKYFADAYLAQDAFDALITGSADSAISNQQLKELYMLAIGNDQAKAEKLAQQNGLFINNLLKRSADIYTKSILDIYIKNLDTALANLEINSQIDGLYPINRLAVNKPQDDPSAKAAMFELLLIDGVGAATINSTDLGKISFFSAGISAQATFKKLYAYLNQTQQQALRSALLNDAHQAKKLPELVAQISDNSDPWGLHSGLKTDVYEKSPHNGALLQGLINIALDDSNFDSLKLSAEKIRQAIEANAPNTYAQYAVGLPEYTYLKMYLENMNNNPGFAEYYLVLDHNVPALNADLVFDCSAIDKNSKQGLNVLNWLYKQVATDDQAVRDLLNKTDSQNRNFFHLLSLKNSNATSLELLKDLVDRAKALNLDSFIATTDTSGKNALHYLLDKNRTDKGARELNERILIMTQKSPSAIKDITDNLEIAMMLKAAINKGADQDLKRLFINIKNKPALAEWCADNRSPKIGEKFLALYNGAKYSQKIAMHNKLINKTYDLGYQQSTLMGGLNHVAELIDNGFFNEPTLKSSLFDPFNTGSQSSLLLALIAESKPNKEADLINLITTMRAKFANTPDWQAYLNSNYIVDKLKEFVPKKDENTAKRWLKFD